MHSAWFLVGVTLAFTRPTYAGRVLVVAAVRIYQRHSDLQLPDAGRFTVSVIGGSKGIALYFGG